MGTFHQGKSELHGMTVVVDTDGPRVFVGRCDDMDEREVILDDADVHEAVEGAPTKAEYLEKAARFGVWKKFERVIIPRSQVVSVTRLGEL